MDEATKTVLSRVRSIDPENARLIVGNLLIDEGGDKEILRLAYASENQLLAVMNMIKTKLGLIPSSSNPSSSSPTPAVAITNTPSPYSSFSNSIQISRPNPLSLSLPSPRLLNAGGLFNPSSPSSLSVWSVTPGSNHQQGLPHPLSLGISSSNPASLTYAAAVNGNDGITGNGPLSSASPVVGGNFSDDYSYLRDQTLPFVNSPLALPHQSSMDFSALSPGRRNDPALYHPVWENDGHAGNGPFHRRSFSVNDVCFDDSSSLSGLGGYKPCLYYNRGFCKNGSDCKFVHGGLGFGVDGCGESSNSIAGPPAFEQELIRSKIAQQQRLATAQLMAGMNSPYNNLNFLQSDAKRAALLIDQEYRKYNRSRSPRHEFSTYGVDESSPSAARQIYLTFPADSTFREEDVSNYFGLYGPVQDVRIPYQTKRMFGFVTFVHPETVRLIFAKGNPHFVCDSRVLVKPYKDKGKLADKKQHQLQLERGEGSSSTCLSDFDYNEQLQVGPRMYYNTPQGMLLRKKFEEQALELEIQNRRMMNLQIMEPNNQLQYRSSPLSSPNLSHAAALSQNMMLQSNGYIQHALQEGNGSPTGAAYEEEGANAAAAEAEKNVSNDDGGNKAEENNSSEEVSDLPDGFEHILPENLLASPTKTSAAENGSVFSAALQIEAVNGDTPTTASVSAAASSVTAPPAVAAAAASTSVKKIPRYLNYRNGGGGVGK